MVKVKVVLPAEEIPLGSTVIRLTGTKPHTIRDRLRVFVDGGCQREIMADGGARFIVAKDGDAHAVSGRTELVWLAEPQDIIAHLEAMD